RWPVTRGTWGIRALAAPSSGVLHADGLDRSHVGHLGVDAGDLLLESDRTLPRVDDVHHARQELGRAGVACLLGQLYGPPELGCRDVDVAGVAGGQTLLDHFGQFLLAGVV